MNDAKNFFKGLRVATGYKKKSDIINPLDGQIKYRHTNEIIGDK